MVKKGFFLIALSVIFLIGCDPGYTTGDPAELQDPNGDTTVPDDGNPGDSGQPVTPDPGNQNNPDPGNQNPDPGNQNPDPQQPAPAGYIPDFGIGTDPNLASFGYREVNNAHIISHGWIETTSPGGYADRSVFRSPEFGPFSRDQGYGLELRYKLKFPSRVNSTNTNYKENNKFTASLLDANGVVRYALVYKPNLTGTTQTADFILYFGDPAAPGTRFVQRSTGRIAPIGDDSSDVSIRLILLPTVAAGGAAEIHVYFDAADGQGARDYLLAPDDSPASVTSLRFSYETGTGALNYVCRILGIELKPWQTTGI